METNEALQIVRVLADGVDPANGELLAGSPLQHPQVVRALFVAVRALEERAEREKRHDRAPANAGKAWTSEEDRALLEGFDAGKRTAELSVSFQRSVMAIRLRLERLGRDVHRG